MFTEISANIRIFYREYGLPFVVDSIGSYSFQPEVNRPLGFPCHHIIWVTDGEGLFNIGNEIKLIHEKEGIFCRAGVPHSYKTTGGVFSTSWLTFYGIDGILDYYNAGEYFCFDTPDFLVSDAENLRNFCDGNSTVISRSAAGYTLVTDLLNAHFAPTVSISTRVNQYLEAHFSEDISLDELSSAININKFSLCRNYQKSQGISIIEQLKKIRIGKAKRYLSGSSCTIEEIGKMCGYDSPSYFSKTFRDETGMTPREYRNKYR